MEVVSFTSRPLYRRYPLDRKLGSPLGRSRRGGGKKKNIPCRESNSAVPKICVLLQFPTFFVYHTNAILFRVLKHTSFGLALGLWKTLLRITGFLAVEGSFQKSRFLYSDGRKCQLVSCVG